MHFARSNAIKYITEFWWTQEASRKTIMKKHRQTVPEKRGSIYALEGTHTPKLLYVHKKVASNDHNAYVCISSPNFQPLPHCFSWCPPRWWTLWSVGDTWTMPVRFDQLYRYSRISGTGTHGLAVPVLTDQRYRYTRISGIGTHELVVPAGADPENLQGRGH